LTDKAFCGSCGGPLAAIGADHLACSKARRTGTCANRRSVRRGVFEDLILGALKSQLLTPDLVATFISEFHQEINRRRREEELAKSTIEAELTVVAKKLDGLIDAIADGLRAPGLQQRLEKFEERKAALERLLAAPALPPVRLHPNLAPLYRERVAKLHAALANPESRTEALELVRSLIDRVELRPAEGGFHVELVGEIANMVTLSAGRRAKGPRRVGLRWKWLRG
jgi:site-specific DNA recombinase